MKKEIRITTPNGCDFHIEKVEITNGVAVVTFSEKEQKLPKSWEEFCEMFPIKNGECFITIGSEVLEYGESDVRSIITDQNVFPDRATAEAVLALSKLIQLRNVYNGDWVPNWKEDDKKYVIEFVEGKITTDYNTTLASSPLYFKTEELRNMFLHYFHSLIEKLKPLYGIFK